MSWLDSIDENILDTVPTKLDTAGQYTYKKPNISPLSKAMKYIQTPTPIDNHVMAFTFDQHPHHLHGAKEPKISGTQKEKSKGTTKQIDRANRTGAKWTMEEDKVLREAVLKYGGKHWKNVAEYLPHRTASQCCQRWKRLQPHKIRQKFTREEDDTIRNLIAKYGTNWNLIAHQLEGRTGKQVRDRYLNHLQPHLRASKFSDEEDKQILELYHKIGPKWKDIAEKLDGRTENMVKNRFYSHLRKQVISSLNTDSTGAVAPSLLSGPITSKMFTPEIVNPPTPSPLTVYSPPQQPTPPYISIMNAHHFNDKWTMNLFSTPVREEYKEDTPQKAHPNNLSSFNSLLDNHSVKSIQGQPLQCGGGTDKQLPSGNLRNVSQSNINFGAFNFIEPDVYRSTSSMKSKPVNMKLLADNSSSNSFLSQRSFASSSSQNNRNVNGHGVNGQKNGAGANGTGNNVVKFEMTQTHLLDLEKKLQMMLDAVRRDLQLLDAPKAPEKQMISL